MLQIPACIFYVQDTLACPYVSYANLDQHFPTLLETSNDITKEDNQEKCMHIEIYVYFLICQIGNE